MVDYKKIGEKIAKKRNALNITQEQLGNKLQTSASYVSNIENGVYGISFERLVIIANELNLSYDYLLNDEIQKEDLKIDGKIKEIKSIMKKLTKGNQEKAFQYIESFLNTMIKIEQ